MKILLKSEPRLPGARRVPGSHMRELLAGIVMWGAIVSTVVLLALYLPAYIRAEGACLTHGYTDYHVSWRLQSYCVDRGGQFLSLETIREVLYEESGRGHEHHDHAIHEER